eukprot:Gregarina_sp_Pseudo_9__1315@NODE_187_length_3734_cov_41_904736_g172_i0_p1_GENE_NODE_187_length_3734_cov_41_904736_g172_i0NODE_187_length_3734_cov_41_904736_g172_i0_p1_ORF_typecomplete_len821_score133_91Dynamin_M/PF01031_20/2e62Dynamin_M/PF01031_20/2_9e03Dynamin_N/PF00350_23/1_5e46GED/PF02212_18/7_4e21FeoB_N/PF02421_18/38FeoB_N/PF02421_18/0_0026MMR_HSR1/PF01926_23/0_00092PduVEutP/PF10662_9/99PduVEutP/PF10662_9/4_9Methyltrans_SAM/PF10672_9/0_17Nucleoporin_FG/PF13634_6/0_3Nucleoporin_FG/PF13634_6/1
MTVATDQGPGLPAEAESPTANEGGGVFQNLRQLINVVDELRDVGLQQYINLPRICVVGTQSAGKSSVLEGIVGMDFLPRGDGVVTRRPLELRLVHLPAAGLNTPPEPTWAVFEGDPQKKKMTDFEQVRRRIDELTDEIAGSNKGIVDVPIVLTVCGRTCPDLTLVDLPGITRVPLKGSDQTDDIEKLTRDMAMRYAKDPRTVILAVIPANQDISTSDALQLARRVDPRGLRTIGVITKIDLMDRGTNAVKMIRGEDIPLRLGYVGIKNRSQADIAARKSIQAALEDEAQFFRTHPAYKTLPAHLVGMKSLVDKLTKVLFRHIRNFLPEIKGEISQKLRALRARLSELGEGVPADATERTQLMWTMINDYCELFCNTIRGKYDKRLSNYHDSGQDPSTTYGGAQVRQIFNQLLEDFTRDGVTREMTNADIDLAIRMHEGDSLPGFPSPDTFEYLILPHLKKIHFPVMECLDRVSQTLELLSQRLANRVFCRFPKLATQILDLSQAILLREKENTRQILENIVAAETGYLFTNDVRYLTEHGAMLPMGPEEQPANNQPSHDSAPKPNSQTSNSWFGGQNKSQTTPLVGDGLLGMQSLWSAKEQKRTQYSEAFLTEIRARLDAYFGIVLRNIRDTVPKTIGFFLVRAVQDGLQFQLYNELNKAEKFDALLGEPPHVKEERQAISKQIETLHQANLVLQRDPSIATLSISDHFDESFDSDLNQMLHASDPNVLGPAVMTAGPQVLKAPQASPLKPPLPSAQPSLVFPPQAPSGAQPPVASQKYAQLAAGYLGRSSLFDKNGEGANKRTNPTGPGTNSSTGPLFN